MKRRRQSTSVASAPTAASGERTSAGDQHLSRFPGRFAATWRNSAILLPAAVVVLAITAAYFNSFSGPFVFDDLPSIPNNRTIRQLWPIWAPLSPPRHGETVTRPAAAEPLAGNQLCHRRVPGLELSCGESGDSHRLRPAAVWHPAADVSAADVARPLGRDSLAAGLVDCLALGGPSAANGVGDVHCPAGRVARRTVLSADAVLFHPRRKRRGVRGQGSEPDSHPSSFILASRLLCRLRGSVPVGHGQQGGNGLRPADCAAVRPDVLCRFVPRGLAATARLVFVPWPPPGCCWDGW